MLEHLRHFTIISKITVQMPKINVISVLKVCREFDDVTSAGKLKRHHQIPCKLSKPN